MMEKVSEKKGFIIKIMETMSKKRRNSAFRYSMSLQDNDRKILQMDDFHTTCNHLCIINISVLQEPHLKNTDMSTFTIYSLEFGHLPHLGRYFH